MKLATSNRLKTAPQPVSLDRPLQIRGIYRDGFNPTRSPQIQERRDADIDGAFVTLDALLIRIDIVASGRKSSSNASERKAKPKNTDDLVVRDTISFPTRDRGFH